MTFPAMHQSASVVTPVTRECVPPCVFNAASLAVHVSGLSLAAVAQLVEPLPSKQAVAGSTPVGRSNLMSLATHQTGVVEDDALNGGAHNHVSSSSHANTSAALRVQRARSAATACAAHLESFSLSGCMNLFLRHGATQRHSTSLLPVECSNEPTWFPL